VAEFDGSRAAVEGSGKHLAKGARSAGGQRGQPGSARRTETLARAAAQLPVRRACAADDVARAYLLAMTNPSITGAVLDVDGGGLL
jgi:hypothetical protein